MLRKAVAGTLGMAVLAATVVAAAQTTADNADKYWRLRDRLRKEFVVVGAGSGEAIPASRRHEADGVIRWADATIRLGWYLAVLATEHAMLSQPAAYPGFDRGGQATTEASVDELYYALNALERLDRVADASFPAPCTMAESLNGFFIRDDVGAGFHANFAPLSKTLSDYLDPVLTNNEMSQDQVYHLLLGLALVKRFIPASVVVQGRPLQSWAVAQAQRIVEHVSNEGLWSILNPACDDRPVARGAGAIGFALGTARAIDFLTDGSYAPYVPDAALGIWELARNPDGIVYVSLDSLHMAMTTAAIGNGWLQTTTDDLVTLAAKEGWPVYPLIHRAIHGNEKAPRWCARGDEVNAETLTMLSELPLDGDVASPYPNGPANHSFTTSSRFIRGADQAYVGAEGSEGERYNGLDFMLLHNVYALATPATWDGGDGPGIPSCDELDIPSDSPAVEPSGCGCWVGPRSGANPWWLALGLGAAWRRRRWRRSAVV